MEALATYLIKSSVWLTGFALVYVLFLRNERFFVLNRIYLVSGILISILFPLFTWHYTVVLPVVPTAEVFEPQLQGIAEVSEPFPIQNVLLLSVYILGISYLVFRILRQTLPVFRIIRKSEIQSFRSAKLIRTAEYPASFSFFSFVFVNPSTDEIETQEIANHELEHIRQQHWIDLLLFEILRTVQWFNPAIWLYGHLIRQNHEYLADERALQRSSNPAIYRAALLNQMFGGPVISLANSFNYSHNKKRFTMMKHTISSPIRKLKLLLILPLIAGVFYAFAAPEYKFENATENQGPEKPLYFISKEKINISFTTQLQKSDLEAIKSELTEVGLHIDYTSLDFTENGNLKQISASVKRSSGSITFTSGNLTPTNYPTFKLEADGSFGVYFQRAVTGKVISEEGKPLKGASVIIAGKTIGTITDSDGYFKLELTDNSPIVISYVGFESQKVQPDFEKEMVIILKTMTVGIEAMGNKIAASKPSEISDNVLVIIDGKESTKAEMTKIDPNKIEKINVIKNQQAIEKYGEKAKDGVIEITLKTDDKATSSQTFKVQANSPLNFGNTSAGNQPLIVIDGVVDKNQNVKNIPPENIESISVIKDKSAAILYGEKGKDGVILIVTKKGISGTENNPDEIRVTEFGKYQKKDESFILSPTANFHLKNAVDARYQPLIVLDGIIDPIQNMDKIDPNTIESINVLKSEMATAKYGEKGGNGVLEITSKKEKLAQVDPNKEVVAVGYGKIQNENQNNLPNSGFQIRSFGTNEKPLVVIDGQINEQLKVEHINPATIVIGYRNDPKVNFSNALNSKIEFGDTKTFGATSTPLFVKDGVISPTLKTEDINPNTIESISVLKDEMATRKYGNEGKNGVIEITSKKATGTFFAVEEMPQFPGGVEALKTYVAASMKYPTIALENGILGQVFVKFVVDKTGNVTNAKVSRGVDPSLDKEAKRIVESMPKWTPGKQNGEAVDVAYEMPINFTFPADYHPKSREKLRATAHSNTKTTYTRSRPDPIKSKAEPTVDQAAQTLQLIIVPNPTNDKATITLKGSDSHKKLDVTIYDRDGKLIKKETKDGPTFSLSFTGFITGTYLIVAHDGTNQFSGQIVVNH